MLQSALAVVSAASTVIQLFSAGGSSIADLIDLQTKMIRNLSDQLAVLQRGIETILARLDEVQRILGRLPEQVVGELTRRRIEGLFGTYVEIMNGYERERTARGIISARTLFAPVIEAELLVPLRETRSTLFTFDEALYIPIVSAALQTEVHAMVLADYPPSRVVPALERYAAWLQPLIAGDTPLALPLRMQRLRNDRRAARTHMRRAPLGCHCIVQKQDLRGPAPSIDYRFGGVLRLGAFEYREADPDPSPRHANGVQELVDVGLLLEEDLPRVVSPGGNLRDIGFGIHNFPSRSEYSITSSDESVVPKAEQAMRRVLRETAQCQPAEMALDPAWLVADCGRMTGAMQESGYALLSLAALTAAGQQAARAIDTFRKDPLLRDGG